VHEDKDFLGIEENNGISTIDLKNNLLNLLNQGMTKDILKNEILPNLGYKFSSFPDEIKDLLN
jgi:hypothetical protein